MKIAVSAIAVIMINMFIPLLLGSGSAGVSDRACILDLFKESQSCKCDVVESAGYGGCDLCEHFEVPVALVDDDNLRSRHQNISAQLHTLKKGIKIRKLY